MPSARSEGGPAVRDPRYVIAVPHLESSVRFYRDVLGFEVREVGDPGWRFFIRDQCFIMAGECPDALPPSELGDHSWFAYLEIDGIDRFHDEIVGRGAEIISPIQDHPWGMREFGIRTGDGHRIRFGSPLELGS
jgi:predicted enzyme related to lactoylglutathione lyase